MRPATRSPGGPTSTTPAAHVAVVIGSTRPNRICRVVATWVRDALQEDSPLQYDLLDLAAVNLPLLDEPLKAALQQYQHAHTREWSRRVAAIEGFLFVFPQYNWGYPAALKNALDFLYVEWRNKPASVFTYGTRGGGKGAQQLAHPQATLRPTLEQLRRVDAGFVQVLLDSQ